MLKLLRRKGEGSALHRETLRRFGRQGFVLAFAMGGLLFGPARAQAPASVPEVPSGSGEYVVGVEDRLRITVWREQELALSVIVRPVGRITFPLVGDIQAAGRTASELDVQITAALADFIREPVVTVIVEEIKYFRVYFLGEFNTRGPIQFYRPTRLLQGVATAGGLTEFAKKDLTILREEYGVEKRIQIDYKQLVAGTRGHENLYLKPGDTVIAD